MTAVRGPAVRRLAHAVLTPPLSKELHREHPSGT